MSERPHSPRNSLPQNSTLHKASSTNKPPHPPSTVLVQQSVTGISKVVDTCGRTSTALDPVEQLNSLSNIFSKVVLRNYHVARVPVDFLSLLQKECRIYICLGNPTQYIRLQKHFGTKRADGSDTLLPTKRMPMA